MEQMQVTLTTIFISRLLVDNIFECLYPLLRSYRHAAKSSIRSSNKEAQIQPNLDLNNANRNNAPDMRNHVSEVELYYYLPEYHEMLGTLNDYAGNRRIVEYVGYYSSISKYACCLCVGDRNGDSIWVFHHVRNRIPAVLPDGVRKQLCGDPVGRLEAAGAASSSDASVMRGHGLVVSYPRGERNYDETSALLFV